MWNYRLIQTEESLSIHEVYYTDSGEPEMWTESPITVSGEDFEDTWNCYTMMKEAFHKPILAIKDNKLIGL
jgi:hypothetical protein